MNSKRGIAVARLVAVEDQTNPVRSGSSAALWFAANAVARAAERAPDQLDEQIAAERQSWE